MPEEIDFSRLKLLREPISVYRNGNGNMRLRYALYMRNPNTQNWEIDIHKVAGHDYELTKTEQRFLAFLLEEELLYIDKCTG